MTFLSDSTCHKIGLRFFDLDAEILSDEQAYVDLFARMYPRFLLDASSPSVPSLASFRLITMPQSPDAKPMLDLDGQCWTIDDLELLNWYFYDCILNTIFARVKSHFLIHAGVVASGGQGVVLSGDSGYGKTTLVLELVRRGFTFLSDEMAALGRFDSQVHPFPRSLRIEPGTLNRTGFPAPASGAPEWLGKLLLDIEELRSGAMGQAASISHIVILTDSTQIGQDNGHSQNRELGVFVNRIDEGLLSSIRQTPDVEEVFLTRERGYPVIRLRAKHRMRVLDAVEQLCQDCGVLILDVSKRPETRPAFDGPVQLTEIPTSQAVMELLRRFQAGHHSTLLQTEFNGSATRLFLELATCIRQAKCYRLIVGSLPDMADAVCEMVG